MSDSVTNFASTCNEFDVVSGDVDLVTRTHRQQQVSGFSGFSTLVTMTTVCKRDIAWDNIHNEF